MAVQTAVDVLARLLDAYDSSDRSVHHVGATSMEEGGGALHVDLVVAVPVGATGDGQPSETPVSAGLTESGHLSVEFPTDGIAAFPSPPEADVSAAPTSARVSDGEVLVSMEVTITPTADAGGSTRSDDGTTSGGTEHVDTEDVGTESDGPEDVEGDGPDTGRPESNGDGRDSSTVGSTDAARTTEPSNDATRPPDSSTSEEPPALDVDPGDASAVGETAAAAAATADDLAAIRDESVPAYEDTAYLRAIYERFDTFAEMQDAIAMDVSTETVRRYMIDVGIHDPSSYETTSAGSPSGDRSPAASAQEVRDAADPADRIDAIPDEHLVTDGIGLPEDLSLEEVLEAVVDSATVYQVTRRLDLDQRRTRELLEQLDLLELVMTRVTDDHKREVTYEDVADRLRRVAGTA